MPSAVPAQNAQAHGPRSAGRRSKSVIIAKNIANNLRCRLRLALGQAGSTIGSSHVGKTLTRSLDYIDATYRDYVFYGNLSSAEIAGKRILEVGAGDNFGVALEFLAAGAGKVVTLDKFVSERNSEHNAAVYAGIRERLGGSEVRNFDRAVDLAGGVRFNAERLQTIEGVGTEEADRISPPGTFSLIVSRAVLEEIYEIDRAFEAMDRLLAPGGRMLHKIDLRDYGMFSNHGMHPLEFLTIPEAVYALMASHSGQPNRRRIDHYRDKLRQLGYSGDLLVTAVAGEPGEVLPHQAKIEPGRDYSARSLELVQAIRPRLARRFRELPDEDLLVTGIFLVARKPG